MIRCELWSGESSHNTMDQRCRLARPETMAIFAQLAIVHASCPASSCVTAVCSILGGEKLVLSAAVEMCRYDKPTSVC